MQKAFTLCLLIAISCHFSRGFEDYIYRTETNEDEEPQYVPKHKMRHDVELDSDNVDESPFYTSYGLSEEINQDEFENSAATPMDNKFFDEYFDNYDDELNEGPGSFEDFSLENEVYNSENANDDMDKETEEYYQNDESYDEADYDFDNMEYFNGDNVLESDDDMQFYNIDDSFKFPKQDRKLKNRKYKQVMNSLNDMMVDDTIDNQLDEKAKPRYSINDLEAIADFLQISKKNQQ